MWLVRSLLIFVAVAAVLAFAIVNVDHRTSLTLFTRTHQDLPLNVVLFCAALFGALVVFLLMVFREIALRATIRRLRRDSSRLDDELTALRNLPLSGLESSQEPSDSPTAEG
ncbi:MAG: lipopolysaccharide assembly protein LapA domain-containing protein [Candidatus Krumholzibacteriia bacterium]